MESLTRTAPPTSERVRQLTADLAALGLHGHTKGREAIPWGLHPIDRALPGGGLALGAVHEFVTDCHERPACWTPPLSVLMHLAQQAAHARPAAAVVWVGAHVFAPALTAAGLSTRSSVFVDVHHPHERLWAMDVALRAGAVVIGNGTGLDLGATRRLQLAAEAGKTIGLVPRAETNALSAAATRWRVSPEPAGIAQGPIARTSARRWAIELLRCKGVQPKDESAWRWLVELDHDAQRCTAGAGDVVPHAGQRLGAAAIGLEAHSPRPGARASG